MPCCCAQDASDAATDAQFAKAMALTGAEFLDCVDYITHVRRLPLLEVLQLLSIENLLCICSVSSDEWQLSAGTMRFSSSTQRTPRTCIFTVQSRGIAAMLMTLLSFGAAKALCAVSY